MPVSTAVKKIHEFLMTGIDQHPEQWEHQAITTIKAYA
jgi:hypothetical protein